MGQGQKEAPKNKARVAKVAGHSGQETTTPPRGEARDPPPGAAEPMSALPELKRDSPPASAEPSSPSKAPRVAGVTALEVWEAIQKWGESDEASNPFAMQRISNVADYVDQLLDPATWIGWVVSM